MKRAGSGGNSSQTSTSDSEEDFLMDMWDDWMGSDSDFICYMYPLSGADPEKKEGGG